MGNTLGRKSSVKIMKINGETFKLKTPVRAGSVVLNHPGHVLLESEAVRHYGVRAKPLEPQHGLKPNRLYFLVQLPKFSEPMGPRRARSVIHVSAKDRLENLMLARRSASDLSIMKPMRVEMEAGENVIREIGDGGGGGGGGVRVRMRLQKAEVERLMSESKDAAELAEKIVGLCMDGGGVGGAEQNVYCRADYDQRDKRGPKFRQKRVGFLP